MCRKCADALTRHFPYLSERDSMDLLMGATAFPVADPVTINRQLFRLSLRTDDLDVALAIADEELHAAMENASHGNVS